MPKEKPKLMLMYEFYLSDFILIDGIREIPFTGDSIDDCFRQYR